MGWSSELSENGLIDPLTGFPEIDAVVWKHGQIIDLGTLGGNASAANAVNNRGDVTGNALNTILDPFEAASALRIFFVFGATQMHAFLWQDGPIQDLGTLGGPDSVGEFVNERGQVAGVSYTSFTPNPGTGIPTQDPFLWDDGTDDRPRHAWRHCGLALGSQQQRSGNRPIESGR